MSREFAFLLNNWILLSCALFVLFATMFPTISEAVNGQRITVGPPFFNKWMVPLALVLLFLAGAAPLLAWRKTTTKRLTDQFMFPVAASVVIMGALAIIYPRSLTLTSIFSNKIQFPVTILNFGIIAFTVTSCLQEFYKGARVRRSQTGSDPFTSLLGITLAKRRRYGGYVIHMGIAVMFIGFAGKSFDHEEDFTLTRPGTTLAAQEGYDLGKYKRLELTCHKKADELCTENNLAGWHGYDGSNEDASHAKCRAEARNMCPVDDLKEAAELPAKMEMTSMIDLCAQGELSDCVFVKGYVFRYDKFVKCPDLDGRPECRGADGDHKTTYTGYVKVFTKEGKLVTDMDPARWVFAKLPDQPTTEPSINVDGVDDVYLAMLGFQQGPDEVANFRLFLNPLINWVWLGFVLLMIGTGICLVPESIARRARKAPTTKVGKLADVGILLLVVGACTFLSVRAAHSQSQGGQAPAGPVYQERNAHGGASAAHEARPDNSTAKRLMKDLGCMCGGCNKEPIHDCKCGFAAQERAKVLGMLSGRDLTSDAARESAYLEVRDSFIARHGQEVLVSPLDTGFNRLAWAFPYMALGGALVLIFVGGRHWVRRGREEWATDLARAEAFDLEDDPAADKLDDELAEID